MTIHSPSSHQYCLARFLRARRRWKRRVFPRRRKNYVEWEVWLHTPANRRCGDVGKLQVKMQVVASTNSLGKRRREYQENELGIC